MKSKATKQQVSRNKYSAEFKDQALSHAEKHGIVQTSKDLGLPEAMLYSWRAKRKQGNSSLENQKLSEAEMARLKREVSRLSQENAFLKKAAAYFAQEPK
jgi:transposase